MKPTNFRTNPVNRLKLENQHINNNTNTSYFQCDDIVEKREIKALNRALQHLPEIDRIFFGAKISAYIKLFSWTEYKPEGAK